MPISLERIEQTQVLGQSLGGFNDLLLRQTLGLCLPPVDPTNDKTVDDLRYGRRWAGAPQPIMPIDGDLFFRCAPAL